MRVWNPYTKKYQWISNQQLATTPNGARKVVRAKRRRNRLPNYLKGYGKISGVISSRYSGPGREYKTQDSADVFVAPAAGGTSNIVPFGLTAGTGFNNRIGNKVRVKSIHFRALVEAAILTQNTALPYRLSLVLDTQANGAVAAATDIQQTTTFLSYPAVTNFSRFITLKEWMGFLQPMSRTIDATGHAYSGRFITWYKKCNILVNYSGITATAADIKSNNLVFFAQSEAVNNSISIAWRIRIRYDDS